MRLGVVSDIHGNVHALRAVLEVLAAERVTHYLCAGDLVGYGPRPNECVQLVRELHAACVAGNHDLMAIGRLDDEGISPLARTTLSWTAAALDPAARDYLAGLPVATVAHGVLLAHGALDDPRTKVGTAAQAAEQLAAMSRQDPTLSLLVLGHTHRPFAYAERRGRLRAHNAAPVDIPASERHLLNPGAVGQARERRALARCLVLDVDERRAQFHAVPYDRAACDRDLRERGLPPATYHLKPTPLHRRARRAAKRLATGKDA